MPLTHPALRSRVLVSLLLAAAYFGAAKAGLELAFGTPSITAVWPPAGIALAALVLGGRRLWPGVALGAFLANVTTDVPIYTAAGITVGNTLEALAGAYLLERARVDPSLRRLKDILLLALLAGGLSTMIAATIGVASLSLGDALNNDVTSAWRIWWLGDLGGVLTVAPLLLVAVTHWPYREAPGRVVEAVALVVGLVAAALLAFGQIEGASYLVSPFIIWAAVRFWQPGAAAAALISGTIAIAYTASGEGQFVQPSKDDSLMLAQSFTAISGLAALMLATITSRQVRAERRARRLAHALQAALLPSTLAPVPGLSTAAWYRAGAEEQEVGGDFYDLFATGRDEWMVVIGDVCGKGPESATLTALARHTLRAVAKESGSPSDVLRLLNAAILEAETDMLFMTVLCGRIRRVDGRNEVTLSNGGHPPPLVLRAGGEVSDVKLTGTMLGVIPTPRLREESITLAPGEALILFTDGLLGGEPAPDGTGQTAWLRAALRACGNAEAAEIADYLGTNAHGPHADADDRALLVIRAIP